MKQYNKALPVIFGIAICLALGFISRLSHVTAMDLWYPFLDKSVLTPPDIVFPIVWGILYTLLGITAGILYNARELPSRKGLLWFLGIQLVLNYTWNILFFYLRNPLLGLINLLVIDILAIIFLMILFRRKRSAAFCFLPYTVWIIFATYLNFHILIFN